jgi:hypothetical protein
VAVIDTGGLRKENIDYMYLIKIDCRRFQAGDIKA